MKLVFLGTCSGTEPVSGYRHISFVIEEKGGIYWFDAGEGCSYTAHVSGVDLLSVKAIFISHPHLDHTGGLPNLLWNIRKLNKITPDKTKKLTGKNIKILLPDLSVWQGVNQILAETEGNFKIDFELDVKHYRDGLIYDDKIIRVRALHNLHLREPADGKSWKSFSFRIESDSKSIVYSGDIRNIKELEPILDNTDLLLVETGHHKVEDICGYLKDNGKNIGHLGFLHHGRAVLADPEGEYKKATGILDKKITVIKDGMTWEL